MRVFLSVLLLLFLSTSTAHASVVINEVLANPEGDESGEYIELKNTGSESVDLTGYKISDKQTTYALSGEILPGGYKAYYQSDTSIKLNNSGDEEVRLLNLGNEIVDNMTYGITTQGKSWSRIPDGTGGFVNGADLTPLAVNTAPPTPTPTNSPTPTPTTEPSATPTPTSTPEDEPTPTTSSKKITPAPLKKPSDSNDLIDLDAEEDEFDVLGTNDEKKDVAVDEVRKSLSGDNSDGPKIVDNGTSLPILPILFVIAGVSFVLAGIYVYKMQNKNRTSG